VPGARVTMFGGSAYEVLFIYRNRLQYTTENNCQKVEVPGTITLNKWGCPGTQAPMVTTPMKYCTVMSNLQIVEKVPMLS
jgi:hypothetical protein